MVRPTVVVGYGTSGSRIVEGVRQLLYEVFGDSNVPCFQFRSIETDSSFVHNHPPGYEEGKNFEALALSTGGPGEFEDWSGALKSLHDRGSRPTWIDLERASLLRARGDGAAGERLTGRMALWANFGRVEDALRQAIQKAANGRDQSLEKFQRLPVWDIRVEEGSSPMIITCGTATGGSFAGAFIDLGYLCRHAAPGYTIGDKDLYALLLMPPTGLRGEGAARKRANAYASLREYEYYSSDMGKYDEPWPTRTPRRLTDVSSPYGYIYLQSQDYGRASGAIATLDGLYRLASLKIFCDLIGLASLRAGGLTDTTDRRLVFALGAVMHPRYQLTELASAKLGSRLLGRWLDEAHYLDEAGGQFPIRSAESLRGRVATVWEGSEGGEFADGLLSRGLDRLGAVEAKTQSLGQKLDRLVIDWREGRGEQATREQLLDAGDTVRGLLFDTRRQAADFIVAEVGKAVRRELEVTQNLVHTSHYATAFKLAIKRTRAYWRRIGIAEADLTWNAQLMNEIMPELEATASSASRNAINLFTNRDAIIRRLLGEATDALKLSIIDRSLDEVDSRLDTLIEQIASHRRMLERGVAILDARASELEAALRDRSVPIARIWSSGSMEGDLERLLERFPRPGAADLLDDYRPDAGATAVWDAMEDWKSGAKKHRGDFDEAAGEYPAHIVRVSLQERLLKDVAEVLQIDLTSRDFDEDLKILARVQGGNLRFKRGVTSPSVEKSQFLLGEPHVVADRAAQVRRLADLREEPQSESLPGLDHALILYHEEYVRSVESIEEFHVLEHSFYHPPEDETPDVRKRWKDFREAYGVVSHIERSRVKADLEHLLRFVGDLCVEWDRVDGGEWEPVGTAPGADFSISVSRDSDGGTNRLYWRYKPELQGVTVAEITDLSDDTIAAAADKILGEPDEELGSRIVREAYDTIGAMDAKWLRTEWDRLAPDLEKRLGEELFQQHLKALWGDSPRDNPVGNGWLHKVLAQSQSGGSET